MIVKILYGDGLKSIDENVKAVEYNEQLGTATLFFRGDAEVGHIDTIEEMVIFTDTGVNL